jgi:hypothetical protein
MKASTNHLDEEIQGALRKDRETSYSKRDFEQAIKNNLD